MKISRIWTPVLFLFMLFLGGMSVKAQVTANFSASPTSGCSPLVVSFTDLSTGGVTNWTWDFGNGNTSTLQNPAAVYITPGTYTVSLTASDGTNNDTQTQTNLITVFQNPLSAFTSSAPNGCAPLTVCFTDNSTPGDGTINQWLWDFGDGNNSALQNPCHTFAAAGSYTITLVVTDDNGCSNTTLISNYVNVSNTPTASFAGGPFGACGPPLTVTFTNTSSGGGGPLTYQWDFGDGNTSTDTDPTNTYTANGSYTITLIATDPNGCADTTVVPAYVNINDVVADFTVDTTRTCEGQPVNFTDLSTGPPSNWMWDFGDGNTSTLQNPSHAYAASGTYTVSLIVGNGPCMDTLVQTAFIIVDPAPTAAFTSDTTTSCAAPLTVNFQDLSTGGAIAWAWDFGDGNTSNLQNPTNIYTATGSYDVTLTVTSGSGCTNTLTINNYINIIEPVADFIGNPRDGCVPLLVNFTDQSLSNTPIVGWQWIFGDGNTSTAQNPSNTYTATGTYTVTLIITTAAGCTDTLVRVDYIEVGDIPIACFSNNPSLVCLNDPVTFTDCSTNATDWFWEFGDGGTSTAQNPVYTYNDTGCFTVTLTVFNLGCMDDTVITNAVCVLPPVADFVLNPAVGCAIPHLVTFTDQSILPDTWLWDFGDGNTSTLQNPTHTYTATGNYVVTLTVTDTITGCQDQATANVSVSIPIADFIGAPLFGCGPLTVDFTDNSTGANAWDWDFGDGNTSNAQNPSNTYQTPGIYTVTLIVTDANGCTDTLSRPNYVQVIGPDVNFGGDTLAGCIPLTVNFTDSTIFGAPITSWTWDFGDGNTSNLQNPTHTYTTAGDFDVSLTVTDIDGCSRTLTFTNYIQVTDPTADFVLADTLTCAGSVLTFNNNSTGTGLSHLWDFGDGNTSTATNPNHSYILNGNYDVSLIVTDVNGCMDTTVQSSLVDIQDVIANFGAAPTNASCPPLLVVFSDSSEYDIVSWEWDFGDGTGSTLQNPSHVYATAGSFDVNLIVVNDDGCTDTLLVPGLVNIAGPSGSFSFAPDSGCTPLTVGFTANALNTASYTWDFGDGNVVITTVDSVDHTYTQTGIFTPILILDDGFGCTFSIISPDPVIVDTIPFPDFIVDTTLNCNLDSVRFTDQTVSTRPITSWFWDFGDGNVDSVQNPVHFYNNPGAYNVTLVVVNSLGCTDTILRPAAVGVFQAPTAIIAPLDTIGCNPFLVPFQDQSTGQQPIAAWEWDFGNGGNSTIQNPNETFATGSYVVTLIAIDSAGCRDTTTSTVTATPGPTATFIADDSIGCPPHPVTFTAGTGQGIVGYNWDLGDGAIAFNVSSLFHTYQNAGNYTVTLIVTDTLGCRDTLVKPQYIQLNPPVADFSAVDTMGCPTLSVTFTDNSTATNTIVDFQWDFGDGTTGTGTPVSHDYDSAGVFTVTLVITDSIGCMDTLVRTNYITVFQPPNAGIIPLDTVGCSPFTVPFADSSSGVVGITNWFWDYGNGNTGSSPTSTQVYPTPGTYPVSLIVTDANGCLDTTTTTVTATPGPNANFVADDSIGCPPHPVTFTGNTGQGIVAWIWDFGDGNDSTTSINTVDHLYLNAGNYDVTLIVVDTLGCEDTLIKPSYILINPPVADFNANTTQGCPILSVTFTDNSTSTNGIVDFQWDFGDGNTGSGNPVNHNYDSSGVFTVTLIITDSEGCMDTAVRPALITVFEPPVAIINPQDSIGCSPFTVPFLDASTGVVGITGWQWDFGNGNTSTAATSTQIYPTPGTSTISLIVTDANGCQDTTSTTAIATPGPNANFVADDSIGCPPHPVTFTANTGQGIVAWIWDFGDGNDSTTNINTIDHLYLNAGNYDVTLIVVDTLGCEDTLIKPNYIQINPPVADFNANTIQGCPILSVTFTDNSTSTNGIVDFQWDFGDGNTGIGNPVTHNYDSSGVFTVTLIITDSEGCMDTAVRPAFITVFEPPVAIINPQDSIGCSPFAVPFIDASTGVVAITGWQWDFGNGNTSTAATSTQIYPTPGTSTISLIVTDANGCQDTTTTTAIATPGPNANFVADDSIGCQPHAVIFTANTGQGIVSWVWDFGDGNDSTTTINTVSHTYTGTGTFDVTLIVVDTLGCEDTLVKPNYIQINPPVANFIANDTAGCPAFTTTFSDIGTSVNGIVAWAWDFGDGNAGVGNPVTHTYPNPGMYTVTLIVTDAQGCMDTIVKPNYINVFDPPVANFGIADTIACTPFTILMADSSTGVAPVTGWNWDFGDGNTSTLQNPSNGYVTPGTYPITLIVTDANGCMDTTQLPFTAPVRPEANFISLDTTNCDPSLVTFVADSQDVVSWTWTFGDGNDTVGGPTVTHFYPDRGSYTVTLIIEDIYGCTDTLVRPNYIFIDSLRANFSIDNLFGCIPLSVNFTDLSMSDTTIVAWNWNFGDTGTSNQQNPTHVYTTPGFYDVFLEVINIIGCVDTITIGTIEVYDNIPPPVPPIYMVTVLDNTSDSLAWGTYQDIDFSHYVLYWAQPVGSNNWVPLDSFFTITDTTYTHTGLNTRQNSYCYRLQVVDRCGLRSDINTSQEHCTIDLEATPGLDLVNLNWNAYVGWGQVDEYDIYRVSGYNPANALYIGTVPGNQTTYVDTAVTCNNTYCYRIRARELGGFMKESYSDTSCATPLHLPNQLPMKICAASVVGDSIVEISWDFPPINNPMMYFLEKSLDGIGWFQLAALPPTQFSYTDTDVDVDERSYYYRIAVLDSCGDLSPWSNIGRTILLIGENNNGPTLYWNPYEEWDFGIDDYEIEVFNDLLGVWEFVINEDGEAVTFRDVITSLDQPIYCYRLTATEANGSCRSMSNIACVPVGPRLYAPNAFTPNADGLNDFFVLQGIYISTYNLRIYDRWGAFIYESNDLGISWDGSWRGKPSQEGVFVWVVKATGFDGSEINLKGTVTLYR